MAEGSQHIVLVVAHVTLTNNRNDIVIYNILKQSRG
jgi:hypothetical protein